MKDIAALHRVGNYRLREIFKAVFVCCILLQVACGKDEPETLVSRRIQALPELPVSIEIAEAATIRFNDPGQDYVLVYVTFKEQEFGIYAGNRPSTPLDPKQGRDLAQVIGANYPVFCSDSASLEGLSGHCLVDLSEDLDYPQYLHFFYNDFATTSVAEVMTVIASVRVLESEGL